jgi:hypothetical protein
MTYDPNNDIDFDKDVNVDVSFDFDSDVNIDFDKTVDIDVDVKSDVDLDGNFAQITFDAQAVGDTGLVEADLVVLTIDNELAMVAGTITSATD